jgi:hypothetical protein
VNYTDPSGEILSILAIFGYTVATHAASSAIVWATMKITSWVMDDPEIPGTVGGYRMSDIADDAAVVAFSVGSTGTLASVAIYGGTSTAIAAPEMCEAGST